MRPPRGRLVFVGENGLHRAAHGLHAQPHKARGAFEGNVDSVPAHWGRLGRGHKALDRLGGFHDAGAVKGNYVGARRVLAKVGGNVAALCPLDALNALTERAL